MIKFSIIIPTRDRCETLFHTICTCVSQEYENLEIIISDNACIDHTSAVVMGFSDNRIKYVKTGRRLSMAGNFEFALGHSTGDYIMFLGDDDALLPGALKRVASLIKETKQKAIISSQALYYWPNALDVSTRNRLVFSARQGYEIRSSAKMIDRVLSFKVPYTELPGLYVGFVSRDIVEAARSNGIYFNSVTPDAYSGFANAALLDTYAYIHTPFSLAGISGRSNGAAHLGPVRSKEADLFESENELRSHPDLVDSVSYEIIMAEAFLTARDCVKALNKFSISFSSLCRTALIEAPPWNYSKIKNSVEIILKKHNLKMSGGFLMKPCFLRGISQSRRVLRGFGRIRNSYQNIDCQDFRVVNINGAADLVSTLETFIQQGYGNFYKKFTRWVKRF